MELLKENSAVELKRLISSNDKFYARIEKLADYGISGKKIYKLLGLVNDINTELNRMFDSRFLKSSEN